MAGIMQPIREPSPIEIENYSRIPQITVSQTGGFGEASRNEHLDSRTSSNLSKLNLSKSYAHGLSNSAETLSNVPTSNSPIANLALIADISPNNTNFFEVMYVGKIRVSHKKVPSTFIDDAIPKFKAFDAQKLTKTKSNQINKETIKEEDAEEDLSPRPRAHSNSYGTIPPYVQLNRTMVFLVGNSDFKLISPDRKKVLLHKPFIDISRFCQGQLQSNHFGIVCRETSIEGYLVYVFKCQSENVCNDILAAISQAQQNALSGVKSKRSDELVPSFSCEHCPLVWLSRLTGDIEGLGPRKCQSVIFRRIETLTYDEQDIIWAQFYDTENINSLSTSDQNKYMLSLLKSHCEHRQERHVHDTVENRSEFLNQYLGGGTIFMKAKRSLTNSIDHLLKRKGSKDIGVIPDFKEKGNNSGEDSNSIGSDKLQIPQPPPEEFKAPMVDIFYKVGNSPKEFSTDDKSSWRQAILTSVTAPKEREEPTKKRTSEEYRELWKQAIRQTILLIRMERENANLLAKQNENEIKKIKLDYDTIIKCDRQLVDRWETMMDCHSSQINKKDPKVLFQAIKNGVPRAKRGEVWTFLAQQHSLNTAPVDTRNFPNFHTPYPTLLKSLTEHQHAIFIDLGRTFPNHIYYKDPLGVGQLSLFNLLKAYSILDPELGYCQGLGFICGVLLLHCEEADAFNLLKHLMFKLRMRMKYLKDMKNFQLQLYQLSRLVKDEIPELYDWFDKNDVPSTLYAAPWILTIFSSQFPLGFVVRVFDLLFLQSSEVVFKFAVGLLSVHKDELLKLESFEDIMDYLKTTATDMDANTMDQILKLVFTMDIKKKMEEYKVEYHVLQEEIALSNYNMDLYNKEKEKTNQLEKQLHFAEANITQLEATRNSQQTQITNLISQTRQMELTIHTLGLYISEVLDVHIGIDLPEDVRHIIQQLEDVERQQMNNPTAKFGKSYSDNSYLRKPLKILGNVESKKRLPSEEKYGKSMSISSGLGLGMSDFALKVIKDDNNNTKGAEKKSSYFDNTYELLRQHRNNSSPDSNKKTIDNPLNKY